MELLLLIPVIAITVFVTGRIVRRRAARDLVPTDTGGRFEELERTVERLQQELAETQERVDFAERLLAQAREDRRIVP